MCCWLWLCLSWLASARGTGHLAICVVAVQRVMALVWRIILVVCGIQRRRRTHRSFGRRSITPEHASLLSFLSRSVPRCVQPRFSHLLDEVMQWENGDEDGVM